MVTERTSFRLSVVGDREDLPRMIRGYGKLTVGEVAFVLRPKERKALLVRIPTPGEALVWQSDAAGDFPHVPEKVLPAAEAVKLVREIQKPMPERGPSTLRGTWSGIYFCDGGSPRVQLRRKLATYGTLFLTSSPDGGWDWEFQRAEKWFAQQRAVSGSGGVHLVEALQRGVLGAMEPVQEACSFRDTRQRRAFDQPFAQKHPAAERPEPRRDPTERLKEPKPRQGRKVKAKAKAPEAAAAAPVAAAPVSAAAPAPAEHPCAPPRRKRKGKKTAAAPAPAPAPAASTLQQLQRAIERADAAFAALRPEPVHAHFGPDVENQDDLDRFDADRAEVQRATEQAIACVSHGDLYRSRGEALKGCFKPLAQARRKAAPWAGRGPDNPFAAAFDLLRRLLSEEGVELPKEHPRTPAQPKPVNGKAKGHGNGRTAASADVPAADPEKDRALLAAFSAAIADAVKGAAA
jgi:hypothetical protein